MLYLVVGEVEVAQGLGHIREGAVWHHLELVVAQVQRLQLRVAEGITGKRSESETRNEEELEICGNEHSPCSCSWVEANFIGPLC